MQKTKIQQDLIEALRLADLGNVPQARVWADRAIAADPENVGTYVDEKPEDEDFVMTVDAVWAGTGHFQEEEVYLKRAAAKFPNDYHIQFSLMNAQELLAETAAEQATAKNLAAILEARVSKGNVDGDVLATLADAYWVQGNHPKALAVSQKAISIYVTDWHVYNTIAYAIADVNSTPDLPQALNNAKLALAQAQKQGGDNVDLNVSAIRDTIGWIEYRMGKYKDAEADMNLALESMPRQSESMYHLAMIYIAEGDKAAAKSELTRALLISPEYADAKTALAQVKDAPAMPPVAVDVPDPSAPVTSAPGG